MLAAYGKATGGQPIPLAGSVKIRGGGLVRTLVVDRTGQYRVSLKPGTYTLTGTSPRFNRGAADACHATGPVPVQAGGDIYAGVICEARVSTPSPG
jgi:hypothetical protein